ncbi:MAG: hypothetical protein ABWZ93_04930 [Xanthobacteraceae bacterium]
MTTFLVRGGYIRVKSKINIPSGRFAGQTAQTYGRVPCLDWGSGSSYKLPQRNDAKDGPVRNFIAQALVIVGVRTAGDG